MAENDLKKSTFLFSKKQRKVHLEDVILKIEEFKKKPTISGGLFI